MAFQKTSIFVTGLFMGMLAGSVAAQSTDEFGTSGRGSRREPPLQIGIGIDFRVDDLDRYTYVPSVAGRVYYFFHPIVALRAGVAHNSVTRLGKSASFHTVAFDLGLHINARVRVVIPYLETGFWLPIHWGTNTGREFSGFRPGLRFAVGISVGVTTDVALDFSLAQVLNHISVPRDHVVLLPPSPHEFIVGPYSPEPEGEYNPAIAEFVVRIGL
ncbi:MAG: hypothetical protein AB1772_03825 [Candidatus Zixiibacteriota bacterium]